MFERKDVLGETSFAESMKETEPCVDETWKMLKDYVHNKYKAKATEIHV